MRVDVGNLSVDKTLLQPVELEDVPVEGHRKVRRRR